MGLVTALMSHAVTVESRSTSTTDLYGNTTETTVSSVVTAGYVEQVAASEVIVGRETYIAEHRLFLPAGFTIDGGDRVIVDGARYEVIGPPALVRNPRTRTMSHIECQLRRVI